MSEIRHAGYWKPTVIPFNGIATRSEIDRLQQVTGSPTMAVDNIYEIGRKDKVCSIKKPPEVGVSLRQFEYGSLEFFLKLANMASGDAVELDDFSASFVDIVGYEGEDEETLKASILLPKCRLKSLGLNIGDASAIIERSFEANADNKLIWQNDNLYFIYKTFTVDASGQPALQSGNHVDITISDPVAVVNPDTGEAMYRVLRVRDVGTDDENTTDLVYGVDFTYLGGVLTVLNCETGDVIKVYYTASSYITGQEYHSLNDIDACALHAYCASIYLIDGVTTKYLYRVGSLSLDASFDRLDVKEIGNIETVETGIRSKSVRVTLNGLVKDYAIEEMLRGVADQNYGLIDMTKFSDTITLVVKIYDDSDKTTFKIGYQIDNLSVTANETGIPVNDFITKSVTLESDNMLITTNESKLAI
jgi:hypothetical protein